MFERHEDYFEPELVSDLQKHSVRTFAWMAVGLLITAVTAVVVYQSNLMYVIYSNRFMPLIILIAQIGVVVSLAARLMKMSPTAAKATFIGYSVLTGITFSTLGLAFPLGTLSIAFGISAVYFGSLVAIGYTTKMNLLRFGPILYGGLFAFIIVELVMYFIGMDFTTMLMSGIGLALFTGITAYDTQKMKALFLQYEHDESMLQKLSIYSALDLYLDFINIFLYILRFVGNRD